MFCLYALLTRPCLYGSKYPSGRRRKGGMTLTTVFLFFVFTTLGLGLLTCSRITLELSAAKKNAGILAYAAESGAKAGWHDLTGRLPGKPPTLTPEELENLCKKTEKGEIAAAERLTGTTFPQVLGGTCGESSWTSRAGLSLRSYEDKGNWFWTVFDISVTGEGSLKKFESVKKVVLEAEIDVCAGYLPAALYPFLIDAGMTPEEEAGFLKNSDIRIHSLQPGLSPPPPVFTGGEHLSSDASAILSRALKIDIFKPQDLSTARLRAALGLPPSEDPVPEGVYLIKDAAGLGGVFVQGDLDELVLAVDRGSQILAFTSPAGRWLLAFNPSESRTTFQTPEDSLTFDLRPPGLVVINGSVSSVLTGRRALSGEIVPAEDEETPAVLSGLQLTLVCSDSITIESHLTHQGLVWKDGIPVVKNAGTQLSLFAAGRDFVDGSEKEGKITIAGDDGEDIRIQAHLTSAGDGIDVEGSGERRIQLAGSLQTKNLNVNSHKLALYADRRFPGRTGDSGALPRTAVPVILSTGLRILGWRET